MSAPRFVLGSLVFHAVLLLVLFLLPPPFPSAKEERPDYIEVQRVEARAGRGRLPSSLYAGVL
ncbi:MAG TPA: hypothetical protein VJM83_04420, partial [Nitrospirota bacterium]|nr:hypothetical protein [Nitrospirota bacterium]